MAPETITNETYKLQQLPDITARIQELEELARKREVTADRAIVEMAKIAFNDIAKPSTKTANLKPIHELDDDTAAAIAGIEVDELSEGRGEDREHIGRTLKIEIADKKVALDSLFKHLGLFTDKLELTGKDGKPIEILDAKVALVRGVIQNPPAGGADPEDQ